MATFKLLLLFDRIGRSVSCAKEFQGGRNVMFVRNSTHHFIEVFDSWHWLSCTGSYFLICPFWSIPNFASKYMMIVISATQYISNVKVLWFKALIIPWCASQTFYTTSGTAVLPWISVINWTAKVHDKPLEKWRVKNQVRNSKPIVNLFLLRNVVGVIYWSLR